MEQLELSTPASQLTDSQGTPLTVGCTVEAGYGVRFADGTMSNHLRGNVTHLERTLFEDLVWFDADFYQSCRRTPENVTRIL